MLRAHFCSACVGFFARFNNHKKNETQVVGKCSALECAYRSATISFSSAARWHRSHYGQQVCGRRANGWMDGWVMWYVVNDDDDYRVCLCVCGELNVHNVGVIMMFVHNDGSLTLVYVFRHAVNTQLQLFWGAKPAHLHILRSSEYVRRILSIHSRTNCY